MSNINDRRIAANFKCFQNAFEGYGPSGKNYWSRTGKTGDAMRFEASMRLPHIYFVKALPIAKALAAETVEWIKHCLASGRDLDEAKQEPSPWTKKDRAISKNIIAKYSGWAVAAKAATTRSERAKVKAWKESTSGVKALATLKRYTYRQFVSDYDEVTGLMKRKGVKTLYIPEPDAPAFCGSGLMVDSLRARLAKDRFSQHRVVFRMLVAAGRSDFFMKFLGLDAMKLNRIGNLIVSGRATLYDVPANCPAKTLYPGGGRLMMTHEMIRNPVVLEKQRGMTLQHLLRILNHAENILGYLGGM